VFKMFELKPKYVFIHSEFYSRATPYRIGCLLLKFPDLNIIVVNFGNLYYGNEESFISHGANSYLDINYGIEKFKEGLKIIKSGERYYSPCVERQFKKLDDKPNYKREIREREWDVLLLICDGHTKKEIMVNLEISKRTVDTHIYNLRKLFYAKNWVDLSNKAVCMGWVSKEDLGIEDIKIKAPQFTSKKKRGRKTTPAHGGGIVNQRNHLKYG